MSAIARKLATDSVTIQNDVARGDLLDESLTQTDLVALVLRAATPSSAGGLGFRLLLTAINSDHGPDPPGSIHGHKEGFAVDVGTIDGSDVGANSATLGFCLAMGQHNQWVTKIGLGGDARAWLAQVTAACPDTVVFADNDQPHIHLQSQ